MNKWLVRGYWGQKGHIYKGSQLLAASVNHLPTSPTPPPLSLHPRPRPGSQPSSPQTAWPGILFIFTMNVLLSGRQSKPRNGIRLSFVYFSLTLRILSLANSPSWFTIAEHDKKSHLKKKKRQLFFPAPLNCHEVIPYLPMQMHCYSPHRTQATGAELKP